MRQQLLDLSADFYRAHADSFDETRRNPWDSWQRILAALPSNAATDLLDLGCGNGRFLTFLLDAHVNITYTGVDAETQLIDKARSHHPGHRFDVATIEDVVSEDVVSRPDQYDAIVSFGVFHHLPGEAYRAELLQRLGNLLRPGGTIALSLWQPKLLDNFDRKHTLAHGVNGLEHDDFLLGWKGDFSHLRYCHHFGDDEIDWLVVQSGMQLVNRFQGSGNDRTNHYVILRY